MYTEERENRRTVDISLRDIIAPLFRRGRLALATFAIAFVVLMLLGRGMARTFKSQMSVLVHRERIDPLVSTESAATQMPITSTAVTLDEINSEAELLKSADLLKAVVLSTGLANRSEASSGSLDAGTPDADRVARAERSLARDLQVHNDSNSDLIQVSYASSNPTQAYEVLKTLASLYIEKHVAVHRPPGSYDFFARETNRYRKELESAEERLRAFGSRDGVAAPDAVRTDLALQLSSFIGQLHAAEQNAAADRRRLESDRNQLATTPQRSPTQQASVPADKLINDLRSALLLAEAKRSQLGVKYQADYPLVREADEELAQARSAIAQAEQVHYVSQSTDRDPTFELLREDLARTRADLAVQESNIPSTRQSIQSIQNQMVDLDEKALTQRSLLRDQKASEDNYLAYLSKLEQARTSDELDKTRIANVAIAVPPSIPVLPAYSLAFITLVACAAAAVLSLVLAYLADYFDSSFHTPAQITEDLGIPVVVAIRKTA